jgi:hypothetical protein
MTTANDLEQARVEAHLAVLTKITAVAIAPVTPVAADMIRALAEAHLALSSPIPGARAAAPAKATKAAPRSTRKR